MWASSFTYGHIFGSNYWIYVGGLFLHEKITLVTVIGGVIVLLGTALTIGIEKLRPQPQRT